MRNVRTRRLLLADGKEVTKERGAEGGVSSANSVYAADRNYYNYHYWNIKNQGDGYYIFENIAKTRYLYAEGDEVLPGDCGFEGGVAEAPLCLGSDANYENRTLWRIIDNGDGNYLIRSVVNYRYLSSPGERPTGHEGNYGPKCVMADANYDDRAVWAITK